MSLIIFDCDGVLVDSEILAHQVTLEWFKEIGYLVTLEESIKNFTGVSDLYIRQLIAQETGRSIPEDFLYAIQLKIIETFKTQLKPLMIPILSYLNNKGVERCVASSSMPERVKQSLEITDQIHFFREDAIFTSNLVEHGKPAPDLFLYTAKNMGVKSSKCIVIEDSIAGIKAALAAEMKVIAFLGGGHTQYPWYIKEINRFKIPIAYNCSDLLKLIQDI